MKNYKIAAICGSLRNGSINMKLLEEFRLFLPENYSFELADLSQLPLFNEDLESDLPASVASLAKLVKDADAVVIACPEYNSSMTGVLKNALDWLSRSGAGTPLSGKITAVMGATPGMLGTVRAQLHLREVLFALNAQLIRRPEVLIPAAGTKFDESGRLSDERALAALLSLSQAVQEEIKRTEREASLV